MPAARRCALIAFAIGAGAVFGIARPAAAPAPPTPVLLVTDPAALAAIERSGGSFGEIVLGQRASSAKAYAEVPLYRDWVAGIRADLLARKSRDARSGVGLKYVHRLFDPDWLVAANTRFELVGVANRIDRRPFRPDRCGETRLVYRLAYTLRQRDRLVTSRLPMTVNVVYFQPDDGAGCRETARRWLRPADLGGEALGAWLAAEAGPLAGSRLASANLKAVEINLQQMRWPSTIRPDMAGHAEYLLRVFHLDSKSQRLVPGPLENTPDLERMRRDPKLFQAFVDWLRDPKNLAAVDAGTARIPDTFAANVAVSVSPRGLARLANRPFAQLLPPSTFAGLPLERTKHIRSPAAFLRRLDGLSCAGCHQLRSVAGFHLLGEEPDRTKAVDALFLPGSPHLDGELLRRREYLAALSAGRAPDDVRPLPDEERDPGRYGAHCGLGDPGFATWRCAPGLVCTPGEEPEVGTCLPPSPAGAGDPCQSGRVRANVDPTRDRVEGHVTLACARDGGCFTNRGGFPAGMCALACEDATADEACGLIPILKDFNGCLARGLPFDRCILDNADPAAMRACDPTRACRDDYICAKGSGPKGICIPPYFLFQLRVDGHRL